MVNLLWIEESLGVLLIDFLLDKHFEQIGVDVAVVLEPAQNIKRFAQCIGHLVRAVAGGQCFKYVRNCHHTGLYRHLVTGEAVGQVSSQTLVNLGMIDKVSETLILRPLIATDKQDIIDTAHHIGTGDFAECMVLGFKSYAMVTGIQAEILRSLLGHPATHLAFRQHMTVCEAVSSAFFTAARAREY